MSYDDIQTACVIRYPYLWAREAHRGETEGRKDRPVSIGVRLPRAGGDLLLLFPITTKEPDATRFASEIPQIEYLEPEPPIGCFSKAFFLPLVRAFIARRQSPTGISRTL